MKVLKSLLISIILLVLAVFGLVLGVLIGITTKIFFSFNKHRFGTGLKATDEYFFEVAKSLDQTCNVLFKGLFNRIMITKDGYQFGDSDETISSVLGKNERDKTLTWFGGFWCWFLNILDKDHCKNSIEKF